VVAPCWCNHRQSWPVRMRALSGAQIPASTKAAAN